MATTKAKFRGGVVYTDRFSSLDDLPKKMYGDDMAVLRALAGPQRFSCFEMTGGLFATIRRLEAQGLLTVDSTTPYPWTNTPLTEAGNARVMPSPPPPARNPGEGE
jgi:hypothetical protein